MAKSCLMTCGLMARGLAAYRLFISIARPHLQERGGQHLNPVGQQSHTMSWNVHVASMLRSQRASLARESSCMRAPIPLSPRLSRLDKGSLTKLAYMCWKIWKHEELQLVRC